MKCEPNKYAFHCEQSIQQCYWCGALWNKGEEFPECKRPEFPVIPEDWMDDLYWRNWVSQLQIAIYERLYMHDEETKRDYPEVPNQRMAYLAVDTLLNFMKGERQ